jgi:hypothetical protein
MSGTLRLSPLRPCPRCGQRPCRLGQRLCGPCHLAYKRLRRAEERVSRETLTATPGETAPILETGGNEMEETPVRVVKVPSAAPLKRRRPGPQVPADWPARFLTFYARHGVRWRAAKYAGVSYDTLVRAERADSAFAQQVENARQTYLDRHALNLNRLAFKKDNVAASIVALKAGRPAEYVEKNMTIAASFTSELSPEDGQAVLRAMLGLPPWPAPGPARGLEGEPATPFPMLEHGPEAASD